MPKKCYTCKNSLDESQFNKNKSRKDGLNSICKQCSKARSKEYYHNNRKHHVKTVAKRNTKIYKINKEKIDNLKKELGCKLCNETEPCCIDFHHINPETKTIEVSLLLKGYSWNRILQEIQKCVLVCANCHRKIHAGILAL